LKKRSTTNMKAIEGTSRISAVIEAIRELPPALAL
jgi:hypothetical protein